MNNKPLARCQQHECLEVKRALLVIWVSKQMLSINKLFGLPVEFTSINKSLLGEVGITGSGEGVKGL